MTSLTLVHAMVHRNVYDNPSSASVHEAAPALAALDKNSAVIDNVFRVSFAFLCPYTDVSTKPPREPKA